MADAGNVENVENTENAETTEPNNEKKKKEKIVAKKVGGMSMSSLLYSLVKKISAVGIVYFAGYMHWSVAWFICPVVLLAIRDQMRTENELKRTIAKATALSNEKDVILARVDDLPAWVFFPDVERAEWLNRIFKQVWPNVNHFTRELIRDKIEPSIRKSLSGYKLNGFKFERIILGSIPPRIGGVKVYDRNISRNEIIMDLDIFYAGDCEIKFILGAIKGGITDFQLHGMLRVVMKPLISTMPLVGGLQIFFLNNPTIEFNLVGVADLLDMPGLSDMLRRVIIEQVASMMVLPNKWPIKLSDAVEAADLKVPEPEGVLRIHVVEAKHLMKKDISMLGKGKSDPYAVLTVGAQEFRTKIITNSVDPKWDYWCEFMILESYGQQLFLHVWDSDDLPKDDEPLGRATIEISNVVKQGEVDMWVTLEQAKHGMVHLRMTWLQLSKDYADLKAAIYENQQLHLTTNSTALLIVYIDSAKNLPQARATSKPDPYVTLSIGKHTKQTTVHMRTENPVWEQGFTFLVGNPESDTLHFKVLDQKTGSDLGQLTYNISQLSQKTDLQIRKQPFGLIRGGPDGKLFLSMQLRILKYIPPETNESIKNENASDSDKTDSPLSRKGSTMSTKSEKSEPPSSPTKKELVREPSIKTISESVHDLEVAEEVMNVQTIPTLNASPPDSPGGELIHRTPSSTSSSGESGLGRIQLTLRYSVQRQKLIVVVHKVANLPLKDPTDIPDPYVKLYLLPDRAKESKRKTVVKKDDCSPVYDETFEYLISQGEMNSRQLEITVVTQKRLFSYGSNVLGQVIIDLGQYDLMQPYTSWMDLLPEIPRDS